MGQAFSDWWRDYRYWAGEAIGNRHFFETIAAALVVGAVIAWVL